MKINLIVMFGGVSCEHDISVITAMQVFKNVNYNKYRLIPIYISKSGKWYSGSGLLNLDYYTNEHSKTKKQVFEVSMLPDSTWIFKKKKWGLYPFAEAHVALLSFHGENGEDGTIPALMQLNQIPYTSCSMNASSLCCDKVSFKYYVVGLGLKTAEFVTVNESEFVQNAVQTVEKIVKKLGYPVIVKPSKLGSSIGIEVCNNEKELLSALDLGFSLGTQVLVEKFLTGIREFNCAVLGLHGEMLVSELEEPVKTSKILSFENKYINAQKNGDMAFVPRQMPPQISAELYQEIVDTSKLLFETLNCKGVIRIDYILQGEQLYINEINTIPGSLANYLFKPKNISFGELLEKMVTIAIRDNIAGQQKIKTFKSDVLKNINLNRALKK